MSRARDTPSANQANHITLSNVRLVVRTKGGWLRVPRGDWRNRAIQPTRVIRVAEVATIPEPACLYRSINSVMSASYCSARQCGSSRQVSLVDTSPCITVELAKVRANTTYVVANSTVRSGFRLRGILFLRVGEAQANRIGRACRDRHFL